MKNKWAGLALAATMACGIALTSYGVDQNGKTASVTISADKLSETVNFLKFYQGCNYSVTANASGGSFVSASATAGIVTPANQSGLFGSATVEKGGGTLPEAFSLQFYGKFRPTGTGVGGNGTTGNNDLDWSINVNGVFGNDSFYISPGEVISIAPTLTSYRGNSTAVSSWSGNGVTFSTASGETTDAFASSAGRYTIMATDNRNKTATATFTKPVVVFTDSSGATINRIHLLPGKEATVKAALYPTSLEGQHWDTIGFEFIGDENIEIINLQTYPWSFKIKAKSTATASDSRDINAFKNDWGGRLASLRAEVKNCYIQLSIVP